MPRAIVFILLMLWSVPSQLGAEDAPLPANGNRQLMASPAVAYIPIEGMIDEYKARYFKRAVEQAVAAKVAAVVVHLTTDGGTLSGGREMMGIAMGVPKDGPKMVAYV